MHTVLRIFSWNLFFYKLYFNKLIKWHQFFWVALAIKKNNDFNIAMNYLFINYIPLYHVVGCSFSNLFPVLTTEFRISILCMQSPHDLRVTCLAIDQLRPPPGRRGVKCFRKNERKSIETRANTFEQDFCFHTVFSR